MRNVTLLILNNEIHNNYYHDFYYNDFVFHPAKCLLGQFISNLLWGQRAHEMGILTQPYL